MKSRLGIIAVCVGLALTACKKNDAATGQPPQAQAIPVSVRALSATSVPIEVQVVAQTEGAKETEIRPRIGGIILKRLYEEGQPIKQGQPLFKIDPVPYQLALAQAKTVADQQQAKITQAKREAERLKGLLASQSISQREYDNAVSDQQVAGAALAQSQVAIREAALNLSYTTVTSPISGIAGRFQFSEGALVQANTSLLTTVAQIQPIWVRFSLSSDELAKLGGHVTASSVQSVQLILPDGSVYPEAGKLNYVASQIDPNLGTQQLRATFQNADKRLLPGQFVRVRITAGQQDGVFLVPQVALVSNERGKFVMTVSPNNEVAPKPVQTAGWSGDQWVVVQGLSGGEQIIVDNLMKLRPGAKVAPHPEQAAGATPATGGAAAPAGDANPITKPASATRS